MTIKNAEGVRGFLLYSPFTHKHFFRIYHEDKSFTDYDVCAEDIEIQILDSSIELYETPERNRLDWSRRVLGKSEESSR